MFKKVEQPKPKPNFVHVDEPEEKDALDELVEKLNDAYDTVEPSLGCFYRKSEGQAIWGVTKLNQCAGEMSKEITCIMDGDYASKQTLYEQMAKMLFYMNAIANAYDDDLTDIVKEAMDIADAPVTNLR